MKPMNYLKKGDKVYLVAPSFGCSYEPYITRLESAIKNFQEDGLDVIIGPNVYLAKNKARSNSSKKCAKEFNEAYLNSDAKAIISVGGGEIMCEILPYIDFEKIKKTPSKIFMGFSDNTNLTYTLTTICDVKTIYGPCMGAFYFKPYIYNTLDSYNLLTGKVNKVVGYPFWERKKIYDENNLLLPPNYTERKKLRLYPNKEVNIQGRLLGGCLDVLQIICGTKYDKTKEYLEKYKDDGFIWYLEACDLNPVAIERALFQLKEAGWFKYVKGFIIGRPLCFNKRCFNMTHITTTKNALKDLHVPLILDADLGHFRPSMPIINGALASVKANDNIEITYLDD